MTTNEALTDIAANARSCWTCGGAPNPANFGGLCDDCYAAHRRRLGRSATVLREHGHTHENSETLRALTHLGY